MADAGLQVLLDERAIRALATGYAHFVDRREAEGLIALFTEDGALTGSGVNRRGHGEIGAIPAMMRKRFSQTYHIVHNHRISLDGDTATGEVYSQAHHLSQAEDGRTRDYIMAITYRDAYVRRDGAWLFKARDLDIQWTQTLWVDPGGAAG
jgi:uncharacterized protein (TIGR02246 family)